MVVAISMAGALHSASPAELKARIEAERRGLPFLVYRDGEGCQQIVELSAGDRLCIGRQPASDLPLLWDGEISRVHARLERVGSEWVVADEGSRNGTFVNEARLTGPRRLRDRDVVRVGRTTLIVFLPAAGESELTASAADAPRPPLSAAQHRVLVALCRPIAQQALGVPATNREIAAELVLGVDTVKAHLRALFDAFDLHDEPQNRKRAALARMALERGVVSRRDLAARRVPGR
jgi:DNA-binding CsgD family transcriptional regulator